VYGAAAVQRFKGPNNRAIWVWAKGASGWRLAAVQASPDAASSPPPQAPRPPAATPSDWQAPAGLSPAQAAVFAAQKQLQDAFFTGDRAAYVKLTAPEFARLLPGGVIRFGLEGVAAVDGPRQRPKFEFHSARVWDKVAIVRWKEMPAGGAAIWLMRVFADEGQGWRQVAVVSAPAAAASTR